MICKNCGFDAGQNRFCTNCGVEMVAEPMQNAAPQQPDYSNSQNSYNPNPGYGAAQNAYNPNPGYGAAQNAYNPNPGYSAAQNTYNPNPGYGAAQNAYNPNPGYGAAQNAYNPNPGYGAPAYGTAPYAPAEDFNIITAYKSFWKKYADFSGRSRRKEYWLASAAHAIIMFVLSMLGTIIISLNITSGASANPESAFWTLYAIIIIYCLAAIVPSIAMTVRRLHDIGKSGWHYFISFIPCYIGSIIMLVYTCTDSQPGPNEYGPNPKGY